MLKKLLLAAAIAAAPLGPATADDVRSYLLQALTSDPDADIRCVSDEEVERFKERSLGQSLSLDRTASVCVLWSPRKTTREFGEPVDMILVVWADAKSEWLGHRTFTRHHIEDILGGPVEGSFLGW